jgi:hypothetical protein
MFVRFRERSSDGREPDFIGAKLQCAGRCRPDLRNRRAGPGARYFSGCPFKPRCRWLIDGKTPYRLLVSLIENRRIDGKVRQEHIADFGAIDGHMLPSFFLEPHDEVSSWSIRSICARLEFWDGLDERLTRLSNRINADEADKVRAAVHARIPKPTAEDADKIEFWNAENNRSMLQHEVKGTRREIVQLEQEIEESRHRIGDLESGVNEYDDYKREIEQCFTENDRKAIEESMRERFEAIEDLLPKPKIGINI